jgi:hypothetical protein
VTLPWNMINTYRHTLVCTGNQDIAEYAIMMAVILVIVVGAFRLIAANAGHVFSSVTLVRSRSYKFICG